MKDALTHVRTLIQCRSVTPEEGGALTYLEEQLSGAGFTCHRLRFSERGTPDVDNLYARIGEGSPHICFAGHTDVVPPGDEAAWRHGPFGAEIDGGILYGRGAADMKGAVASSLAAVEKYLHERTSPLQGSISFLITGDEEGPAINGTRKVLDWLIEKKERLDFCVLGECTSEATVGDTIKIGRRGSLSGQIRVRGVQGHSAYPDKARNPLPALIDALSLLKAEPLDKGSEHFQPSNLEITGIDTGNTAFNVIPATATARFNIRFNDRHSGESLKAWVDSHVGNALRGTGVDYTLEYEPVAESFVTEPTGFTAKLAAAVQAETRREPILSTAGGTSDARFIKDICPVAELGLLNASAHKVDECVPIADIEKLVQIYIRFLKSTLD